MSIFKLWPDKNFAQGKKMLEQMPRGSSQVKLVQWALPTALILQCPGSLLRKPLGLSACRLGCGRGVGTGDCKWQTEKRLSIYGPTSAIDVVVVIVDGA